MSSRSTEALGGWIGSSASAVSKASAFELVGCLVVPFWKVFALWDLVRGSGWFWDSLRVKDREVRSPGLVFDVMEAMK